MATVNMSLLSGELSACDGLSQLFGLSKKEGNGEDRNIVELAQTPCALYIIQAEVCDSWVSMTDVGTDPCPVHSTPCILYSKGKIRSWQSLVPCGTY